MAGETDCNSPSVFSACGEKSAASLRAEVEVVKVGGANDTRQINTS